MYSTLKDGIQLFTYSPADELSGDSIRVNTIQAGLIDTTIIEGGAPIIRTDREEQFPR